MAGEHHQSSNLKRRADEEPEAESPITKRLARMRIDQPHLQPRVSPEEAVPDGNDDLNDRMYLDDTKDRIYIHDLQSEIALIEAEEPKSIFLPDIEKKISAIPQRLLEDMGNNSNTQLILYQVPSSISIPEEQDHVRKAIIASRARTRAKQERQAEESKQHNEGVRLNNILPHNDIEDSSDLDAMDIG